MTQCCVACVDLCYRPWVLTHSRGASANHLFLKQCLKCLFSNENYIHELKCPLCSIAQLIFNRRLSIEILCEVIQILQTNLDNWSIDSTQNSIIRFVIVTKVINKILSYNVHWQPLYYIYNLYIKLTLTAINMDKVLSCAIDTYFSYQIHSKIWSNTKVYSPSKFFSAQIQL